MTEIASMRGVIGLGSIFGTTVEWRIFHTPAASKRRVDHEQARKRSGQKRMPRQHGSGRNDLTQTILRPFRGSRFFVSGSVSNTRDAGAKRRRKNKFPQWAQPPLHPP